MAVDALEGNGFVLAGGGSRRMGRDKATLAYEGSTLIDRTVQTLVSTGLDVTVLVRPDQSLVGFPTLEDTRPGSGPLGAIFTALANSNEAINCFLPCDMPRVPAVLFATLAAYAADFDVVVPEDSTGRIHHLCAQLGPGCQPVVEALLDSGRLRVDGLLDRPELQVKIVKPEEHGMDVRLFRNLNQPGDLV